MSHKGTWVCHKLALRVIEYNCAPKLFLIMKFFLGTIARDIDFSREVYDGYIGVLTQIQIDYRHFMIRSSSSFLIESHGSSLVHLIKTFFISFLWTTHIARKLRLSSPLHFCTAITCPLVILVTVLTID